MSNARTYDINITTSTGGAATAYSDVIRGQLMAIKYTKDGSTPLASTADITVTTEDTGQSVMAFTDVNATTIKYPVAIATTASGSASPAVPIYAAYERVKVVVAQGGNTKVGTITVIAV